MARQNIFEILKSKYDIVKEINKIMVLYNKISIRGNSYADNRSYSIEKLFETKILPNWKQRGAYLSCEEIRNDLDIVGYFVNESKIDDIMLSLEYIQNILYLIYKKVYNIYNYVFPKEFDLMLQNINILLEHLNCEIKII